VSHAEVPALLMGERARATAVSDNGTCARRTGSCAARVVDAGIRRAVIAIDNSPRGRGPASREHGIEVKLA
jgi:pyrimidine deaminase RibD-like protein